jgi:hypothetical protein
MLIQFAGYDIKANSRIYNFGVVDPPRATRQFTVRIESKTSRWGSLKHQDGPSICFERLRHELERETPELCAQPRLRIEEKDVHEYLARQNPHKKALGYKLEGVFSLTPRHTQAFPAAGKPVTGLGT